MPWRLLVHLGLFHLQTIRILSRIFGLGGKLSTEQSREVRGHPPPYSNRGEALMFGREVGWFGGEASPLPPPDWIEPCTVAFMHRPSMMHIRTNWSENANVRDGYLVVGATYSLVRLIFRKIQ